MTREEAIAVFRGFKFLQREMEAVDMAIKVLEQEPCEDAVSLEAVIEWLKSKDIIKLSSQADTARKELKTLSSGKLQPSGDAISRQALITSLQGHRNFFVNSYGTYKHMAPKDKVRIDEIDNCIARIVNAPSVIPQPKIGHWITTRTFMHDGEFYCDKCKCDSPNNEKWDYCPNCGCVMKGELE